MTDLNKTALLVIDMQNDFCLENGSLSVEGAMDIIEPINEAMKDPQYDLIVASQDWHPQDHGSFASNHEGYNLFDTVDLNGLDQIIWPDHCIQNTSGSEFVGGLETSKFDKVIRKGTNPLVDSYSAFYDNGHRVDSGLSEYLKHHGVQTVHVCGVATNFCCLYTCLDALFEGFSTTLLYNLSKGVEIEKGNIESALKNILDNGGSILS